MRRILAPLGGAISFAVVVLLVIGGLTWVTIQSLHVESEQRLAIARADAAQTERLALWQLDSRLFPAWGVENNRHYAHYFAFYVPYPLVNNDNLAFNGDSLQVTSPILTSDLQPWMKLHFQLDPESGWDSPQVCGSVPDEKLLELQADLISTLPYDVNIARAQALTELRRSFPVKSVHEQLLKLEKQNPADSPLAVPLPYQMVEPPKALAPPVLPMSPPGNLMSQAGGKNRGGEAGEVGNRVLQEKATKNNYRFFESEAFRALLGGACIGPPDPLLLNDAGTGSFGSTNTANSTTAMQQQTVRGSVTANAPQPGQSQVTGGYDARNAMIRKTTEEIRGSGRDPGGANYLPDNAKPGNPVAGGGLPTPAPPAPVTASTGDSSLRLKQDEAKKEAETPPVASMKSAAAPLPPVMMPPETAAKPEMKPEAPAKEENFKDKVAKGERGAPRFESKGRMIAPAKDGKPEPQAKAEDKKQAATLVPNVKPPIVQVGPMRPVWLTGENGKKVLVLVRAARLETKMVFQGVLLDWDRLQTMLLSEVAPQLPQAKLEPDYTETAPSDRRMTALPAVLEPAAEPVPPPAGWTTLRIGLLLGWIAALAALAAVGFVGWTLIDLSERRIRFVSAVTHELRTPLTSLRLYTDLLSSGMIAEEEKQQEYLRTIGGESERLNTLVENVLDFAKLEKRSVRAHCVPTPVATVFEEVKLAWGDRLHGEGRELVLHTTLPENAKVTTDVRIATQILGTLLDNARKYSRDAEEKRIWLWAKPGDRGRVVFEVEDRGPGVPVSESGTIFKPFRRGNNVTSTGGAGLGLALAKQWTALLGGTLSYRCADGGTGACFRLELPG